MRYLTRVLISCFALIIVVGVVSFCGKRNNSVVRHSLPISNSPVATHTNGGMTKPFFPLVKVELDESVRESLYQSAKKFREERWHSIYDVDDGADVYEIFNALFLSTTIPLWRVPNVWTEDGNFLYMWYSEESSGYCIDKKTLTYSIWHFDSAPVFVSKEKPVLSRFSHLKPKLLRTPEEQEVKAPEN